LINIGAGSVVRGIGTIGIEAIIAPTLRKDLYAAEKQDNGHAPR
jgi:hypothetical protein